MNDLREQVKIENVPIERNDRGIQVSDHDADTSRTSKIGIPVMNFSSTMHLCILST
jgi:hypothetical protein